MVFAEESDDKGDNLFNKNVSKLLNREVISYVIVGILTTLVNLLVFTLLSNLFGSNRWWLSNFPAILAAILFAFWANRSFVFRSQAAILPELVRFLGARAFTALAFEYGAMFLLTEVFNLRIEFDLLIGKLMFSKLLTQALVLIGNYIFSKIFVFKDDYEARDQS